MVGTAKAAYNPMRAIPSGSDDTHMEGSVVPLSMRRLSVMNPLVLGPIVWVGACVAHAAYSTAEAPPNALNPEILQEQLERRINGIPVPSDSPKFQQYKQYYLRQYDQQVQEAAAYLAQWKREQAKFNWSALSHGLGIGVMVFAAFLACGEYHFGLLSYWMESGEKLFCSAQERWRQWQAASRALADSKKMERLLKEMGEPCEDAKPGKREKKAKNAQQEALGQPPCSVMPQQAPAPTVVARRPSSGPSKMKDLPQSVPTTVKAVQEEPQVPVPVLAPQVKVVENPMKAEPDKAPAPQVKPVTETPMAVPTAEHAGVIPVIHHRVPGAPQQGAPPRAPPSGDVRERLRRKVIERHRKKVEHFVTMVSHQAATAQVEEAKEESPVLASSCGDMTPPLTGSALLREAEELLSRLQAEELLKQLHSEKEELEKRRNASKKKSKKKGKKGNSGKEEKEECGINKEEKEETSDSPEVQAEVESSPVVEEPCQEKEQTESVSTELEPETNSEDNNLAMSTDDQEKNKSEESEQEIQESGETKAKEPESPEQEARESIPAQPRSNPRKRQDRRARKDTAKQSELQENSSSCEAEDEAATAPAPRPQRREEHPAVAAQECRAPQKKATAAPQPPSRLAPGPSQQVQRSTKPKESQHPLPQQQQLQPTIQKERPEANTQEKAEEASMRMRSLGDLVQKFQERKHNLRTQKCTSSSPAAVPAAPSSSAQPTPRMPPPQHAAPAHPAPAHPAPAHPAPRQAAPKQLASPKQGPTSSPRPQWQPPTLPPQQPPVAPAPAAAQEQRRSWGQPCSGSASREALLEFLLKNSKRGWLEGRLSGEILACNSGLEAASLPGPPAEKLQEMMEELLLAMETSEGTGEQEAEPAQKSADQGPVLDQSEGRARGAEILDVLQPWRAQSTSSGNREQEWEWDHRGNRSWNYNKWDDRKGWRRPSWEKRAAEAQRPKRPGWQHQEWQQYEPRAEHVEEVQQPKHDELPSKLRADAQEFVPTEVAQADSTGVAEVCGQFSGPSDMTTAAMVQGVPMMPGGMQPVAVLLPTQPCFLPNGQIVVPMGGRLQQVQLVQMPMPGCMPMTQAYQAPAPVQVDTQEQLGSCDEGQPSGAHEYCPTDTED